MPNETDHDRMIRHLREAVAHLGAHVTAMQDAAAAHIAAHPEPTDETSPTKEA